MSLILDSATEKRIQRKTELGQFREPAEVIARALDLLDEDREWSNDEMSELDRHLATSMAAAERGELYTPEQARRILAEGRAKQLQG